MRNKNVVVCHKQVLYDYTFIFLFWLYRWKCYAKNSPRFVLSLTCVHYEPLSCAYCAHCAKFTPHASTAMSTSPTGMFITPPTPTHVTPNARTSTAVTSNQDNRSFATSVSTALPHPTHHQQTVFTRFSSQDAPPSYDAAIALPSGSYYRNIMPMFMI